YPHQSLGLFIVTVGGIRYIPPICSVITSGSTESESMLRFVTHFMWRPSRLPYEINRDTFTSFDLTYSMFDTIHHTIMKRTPWCRQCHRDHCMIMIIDINLINQT